MEIIQEKIHYPSPLGYFEIIGTSKGIQSVRRIEKTVEKTRTKLSILKDCVQQLEEYFDRKRTQFDLSLDWQTDSDFNRSVWQALTEIPYGQTCSYSDIAQKINNPAAVRAVGLANRNNPIAIIVPCHRVLGKNGDLTGYFYGLDVKRQLLELENPMSFAQQGSLF